MKDEHNKSQMGGQKMGAQNMGDQQKSSGHMGETQKSGGQSGSGSRVQGEGDYESARRYQKDIGNFVSEHKGDIPKMAKDAEKSLDSSEGSELRRAEQEGKSHAKK